MRGSVLRRAKLLREPRNYEEYVKFKVAYMGFVVAEEYALPEQSRSP